MKNFLLLLALVTVSNFALAQDLIINGGEFGIGKFHRRDNKEHAYEANNAWKPYVLPENVSTQTVYVQQNSPTNFTIFFTNLEEFLSKVVEISAKTGKKVSVLNLHAHGLPGGMWFPKDAKTRDSRECASWKKAANNSDDANYKQYYSPILKSDIQDVNDMSDAAKIPSGQCLTGINEWTEIVAKVPAFKSVFTANAQIHMLSCTVGLGSLGEAYTMGLGKLLFANPKSQMVQTAIKFGLGDWSMPAGMGFWAYESDDQLDRDNSRYPTHRRDSEMAQKGNIRVAQVAGTRIQSAMMSNVDVMVLTHDDRQVKLVSTRASNFKSNKVLPATVRIPRTGTILRLR